MAIRSGLFNSVNGDRRYKADFFAEYFASFIANGVFPNPSTGLQVLANQNMTVAIKPGKAWINGYFFVNDSDFLLTIDNADGVLNRIDRIVLQLNYLNREIVPVIKKGTPASSPVAVDLQRDADAYEIALADVFINKGVLSISQANITDLRLNSELCGIVHGTINQVDTTTIFNQYMAWFQQVTGSTEQELANWEQQMKQDFLDWFNSLQDILDDDAAANLANRITDLDQRFTAHQADYVKHSGYGVATGSANTYAVTLNPVPTSYVEGMAVSVKINVDNTGASTININNLGAKSIKKPNGNDVSAGNLKAGSIYTLRYNGTNFILQGEGGGGTAQPGDVLSGKTFTNDNGDQTGTMPNRGAITITPGTSDQSIPAGYHNGNGKVVGDPDLIPANIRQGVNIFGVVGNLEPLEPGDNVVVSATTPRSHDSTSPLKLKEIRISKKGTYRVKFDLFPNGVGFTAYARIYVNDVGRGILRSNNVNSSPITFTEDITINDNDLIQIYAWSSNDGFEAVVSNMTIGIDRSFTVNLN